MEGRNLLPPRKKSSPKGGINFFPVSLKILTITRKNGFLSIKWEIFSLPPPSLDFYSGRGGGEKKNLGHFEDPRKITLPPRKFPRSSPVFS